MKRIFLIFLCLTILGTLCACRVRLIADPAQADTILAQSPTHLLGLVLAVTGSGRLGLDPLVVGRLRRAPRRVT